MQNFIKKIIYFILANLILTNLVFAQSEFKEENLNDSPKNNNLFETTKIINEIKDKLSNNSINSQLQSAEGSEIIKDSLQNLIINKKTASLMFNKEESANIKTAIDSYYNDPLDPGLREKKFQKQNPEKVEAKKENNENQSNIYLASILFLNQDNWAAWINNEKITSQTNSYDNEIFIKSISHNKIKIIWQMGVTKWKILSGYSPDSDITPKLNKDGKIEIATELKPNQTFILKTKKIIEGKIKSNNLNSGKDSATIANKEIILPQ
jgi:hypothetical protein